MKNKKIVIKNDIDYLKFIKKLKFYKSFFFFNTIFFVDSDYNTEEVNDICLALNIKNRNKRIEFIYNKACQIIADQNLNIDTCGFKSNKCFVQQKLNNNKSNGCCRLCLYQSTKGCITENLTCKLFNCSEVKCRYKVLEYKDIEILKLLSLKNRFIIKHDYFSLKEDVLKDLYSISFFYSCIRILYRFVRNILIVKFKKN